MKKILLLAAAGVVLGSNISVIVLSQRNRTDMPGGTLELTERELRLPPIEGDSTAILLRLRWELPGDHPETPDLPDWLDAAKLAALGFDCDMPVSDPHARQHYFALPPRPCFVVLELNGEAWQRTTDDGQYRSRLFVIDAGTDPARLREKYPDSSHFIIARGLVRPRLWHRDARTGHLLSEPRLSGRVEIVPNKIFVARPYGSLLQGLRSSDEQLREQMQPPRFAATVSWGIAYEPWLREFRLLPSPISGGEQR